MTAREIALEQALKKALPFLERAADPEPSYGHCIVKDPRLFHPDPECSTEEERANHKTDCEAWNRGEKVRVAAAHTELDMSRSIAGQIKGADLYVLEKNEAGEIIGGHVTRAVYGQGTNLLQDDDAVISLAAARAVLGESAHQHGCDVDNGDPDCG